MNHKTQPFALTRMGQNVTTLSPFSERLCLRQGPPLGLLGQSGCGKSLLAEDLALAVAAGVPTIWGDVDVQRGKAAMFECSGLPVHRDRWARLAQGRDVPFSWLGNLYDAYLPDMQPLLASPQGTLESLLDGFSLAIFDSFRHLLGKEWTLAAAADIVGRLTHVSMTTGCAVVVVHGEVEPTTRPDDVMAVGALDHVWSSQWVVRRKDNDLDLTCHNKGERARPPLHLYFEDLPGRAVRIVPRGRKPK